MVSPPACICACCAPHVDSTGQIGLIKITGCQSYKGGVRLTILCGQRALNDYRTKFDNVSTMAQAMSVKQDQIVDAFEKLRIENQSLQESINLLQAKYLSMALSTLPAPTQSRHAVLFTDITDNVAIRNAVNELTGRYEGYCAIFFGEENNYRFILGSSREDCNEMAKKFQCAGVQFWLGMFDNFLIDRLHSEGIWCNLFYADNTGDYKKYFEMGIDTLLTNRMDIAAEYKKYNKK